MIVFFLPRKMYPRMESYVYIVEDGYLPLFNTVDEDILYGLVLDNIISISDFHKICSYTDLFDLSLFGDIYEYIAEYCWLNKIGDKVKDLREQFFHIIRLAPTFSIVNVLKNNFNKPRVIDITFLNNEQLRYVYRFSRENDVVVSHYFRLDVLNLCDRMVLHRNVERQYFIYSKLNPSARDEAFRIFKDKEYVAFNLINGYYSILEEKYGFIEYSKKKFVRKSVDYSRFRDVLELIDEVVRNGGVLTFKMLYDVTEGKLDVLAKALNYNLLEHRQGQIVLTSRGVEIYERLKTSIEAE